MSGQLIHCRPIRLIPWDIGCALSEQSKTKIISELRGRKWKSRYLNNYCRSASIVGYRKVHNRVITLDLYKDGIAIFSIHERVKIFDSEQDLDPVALNQEKTNSHIMLLKGSHPISELLSETMQVIWGSTSNRSRRKSGSRTWENRGLSYVFSFFLLRAKTSVLKSKHFQNKIGICLFPVPIGEAGSDAEMDQVSSILEHSVIDDVTNIRNATIALLPFRHVYFSWATAVIAGSLPTRVALEFCRTMRNVQHAWFYAYITDQYLDEVTNDLGARKKIDDLLGLDITMSRVYREMSKITSISNSMATGIEVRTTQIASRQSGMETLALSIQAKLQYVRNEIATRINKRSLYGQRSIETILVVLTCIQAIAAYKTIQVAGGFTLSEVTTILAISLLLSLFLIFR